MTGLEIFTRVNANKQKIEELAQRILVLSRNKLIVNLRFMDSAISSEYIAFFVRILVNKGLDADGGSFAVVGNLLM